MPGTNYPVQGITAISTTSGTSVSTGSSSSFAPNYGGALINGLVTTSTLLTNLEWDAIGAKVANCGHHLIPQSFAYEDGRIIASCPTCNEVFAFEAVPGGISYLRIQALVADLLDGDPEVLSVRLGEFVALRAMIDAELAALEEGRELLRIAHSMLNKQLKAPCATSRVPESVQI